MASEAIPDGQIGSDRETPGLEQGHDLSDEEIVERVRSGEVELFELLMRRYNQRLYRVARAVLRDDGEAEDVTQEAWVRAFTHLDQFAGRARFSTWLTRIALYEAWGRARRSRRFESIDAVPSEREEMRKSSTGRDPERKTFDREIGKVLETAIEALPQVYRAVFVLREIEALSTAETAACLDLTEEAVKTRLHRARALLRRDLLASAGAATAEALTFAGARCNRMVESVFARIGFASLGSMEVRSSDKTVH
jgi:RNA polymerase sigma-70 factor (ECF subfamily)